MRIRYEERKKGVWTIVIDKGTNPITGKRDRDHEVFHGKKADAEKRGKQILAEYEKGAVNITDASKITITTLLEKWLEAKQHEIGTQTFRKYRQIIEHRLIPNFGGIAVNQLHPLQIQEYFNHLIKTGERCDGREGSIHYKTIRQYLSVLKLAFEYAIELRYLTYNPTKAVKFPHKRKVKSINKAVVENKKIQVYDEKQIAILLDLVKRNNRTKFDYYEAVCIALGTGMRRNEILALRWEDIDWKAKKITVQQALVYDKEAKEYDFDETKTGISGVRTIRVNDDIIDILKKVKIKQNGYRLLNASIWQDRDLVFCRDNGEPWEQDSISNWFYRLLKRNADKLPRIRFHDLRHTHATLLLRGGEHIKAVSERLGHASIRTTMDTYAHLLPDMQEKSVSILEEAINFKV